MVIHFSERVDFWSIVSRVFKERVRKREGRIQHNWLVSINISFLNLTQNKVFRMRTDTLTKYNSTHEPYPC